MVRIKIINSEPALVLESEKNNLIIEKKKINRIFLKSNDKIEIVHFIGGG